MAIPKELRIELDLVDGDALAMDYRRQIAVSAAFNAEDIELSARQARILQKTAPKSHAVQAKDVLKRATNDAKEARARANKLMELAKISQEDLPDRSQELEQREAGIQASYAQAVERFENKELYDTPNETFDEAELLYIVHQAKAGIEALREHRAEKKQKNTDHAADRPS